MLTPRVLSGLTVLLGLYASWSVIEFSPTFDLPGMWPHVVPSFIVAICGLAGGARLWNGTWLGYLTSTVAWATTLATGIELTSVDAGSGVFISVAAIVSVPILVAFYVAIRAKKRGEST